MLRFEVELPSFELEDLGFEVAQIDLIMADEPEEEEPVPEVETEAVSTVGDLWLLDKHRLLCGDARLPKSYATLMGEVKAKAVFTDPPFGCDIDGFVSTKGKHCEFVGGTSGMSETEVASLFDDFNKGMAPHLAPGAVIYEVIDWRTACDRQLATYLAPIPYRAGGVFDLAEGQGNNVLGDCRRRPGTSQTEFNIADGRRCPEPILTGSVRRSPETIRIGAQLVNGSDGVEKWAQNYDRAPGDTIKIQTDIATQVAGALSIELGAVKKAALTLGGTANAKAQDLYLQADTLVKSADSAQVFRKAITLCDAALAGDANYGDAHLGKAVALARFATQYITSPAELAQWLDRADQSARRAATLMPGSGRPMAMFAEISADRLDFVHSLRGFSDALTAEPNNTFVLRRALNNLPWLTDGASALALANRLIGLDPLDASAYGLRGVCLYVLRRYEDATRASNKALALAPQRNNIRAWLSRSLILLNRAGEARAVLEKMPLDNPLRQTNDAIFRARGGDRAGAETLIARIRAVSGDSSSFQYGQVYAQIGDLDRAFAALDQAVKAVDPGLLQVKRDPFLDPIRRDPRYAALLQRLNFP